MDVRAVRATLGRAYTDDPLTEWIFQNPITRADACAAWYGLFAEAYAVSGRCTHLVEDGAVCLWRRSDDPPLVWPSLPSVAGLLDALAGPEHGALVADALHGLSALDRDETHVYVNFLAVEPERQGRGAGQRAIAPALAEGDSSGIPVCLETTNPRNAAFYERLGFVEVARLDLYDGGPVLRALRRPAG